MYSSALLASSFLVSLSPNKAVRRRIAQVGGIVDVVRVLQATGNPDVAGNLLNILLNMSIDEEHQVGAVQRVVSICVVLRALCECMWCQHCPCIASTLLLGPSDVTTLFL